MGKSKLVVAIGTTVAMAALPLVTANMASASTSGSNSGSAVTRTAATAYAPTSKTTGKFKAFEQPKGKYTKKSCAIDLSSIADFTEVTQVSGCGQTVNLSISMNKRTVPNGGWASWGSPPWTETATPAVLYSNGATSVTLTFAKSNFSGVEVEPNPFEVHTFNGVWKNKKGKEIGSATADADGSSGARLIGAKAKKATSLTISSDIDFAIAQIRVKDKS